MKKLNLSYQYFCKLFKFKKNNSLLDFGSGSGYFLYYVQRKIDLQKISVEINPKLIKYQKKILKKTKYILWNVSANKIPIKIKNCKGNYLIANSSLQYLSKKIIYILLNIFITNFEKILLIDVKNKKFEKRFYTMQENKYNVDIKNIYSKKNKLNFFYKKELIFFLNKFNNVKYRFIDKKKSGCSDEGFSLFLEKVLIKNS
jgi:SAM-dependent MidA family methyltransferase